MSDKPDPRPTISVKQAEGGTVTMTIQIPRWCIDYQSHALTHDQLKHLTGRELSVLMIGRRQKLEEENDSNNDSTTG